LLEINQVYNMDCIEGMKLLDDNSVDSIVTDPPYELGFMGKKWDSSRVAYSVDVWRECLRVLKPGGHLLSFGGTRTYHRMACAIEDAGFEIRDQIQWVYGSGFPKSMNISKAIDKAAGAEPEAIQWQGWGTALKPANEPIVVARKRLSEKTIVANVLKWGTGGINIDKSRIGTTDKIKSTTNQNIKNNAYKADNSERERDTVYIPNELGRFPANVILDEEAGKLLDEQTGVLTSGTGAKKKSTSNGYQGNTYGKESRPEGTEMVCYGDSGGASRFFYCSKASKKDRGLNNNHPTVKPQSLMKYLITLVTPPGGLVLDPFSGSGTTLVAAQELTFGYLGFELDKNYCNIANERIKSA